MNIYQKDAIHHMIEKLVCDPKERECALRVCDKCPQDTNSLWSYLKEILEDFDDNDEIRYSQWVQDSHIELKNLVLNFQEFISLFIKKVEDLIPY